MINKSNTYSMIFILLMSCANTVPQEYFSNKIEKITVQSLFEKGKDIILEQNNNSVISDPFNFIILDSCIVVSSWNSLIKIFDNTGKYMKSIGKLGDGPGEYRRVKNLFKISENVFGVYDMTSNKIISYSLVSGKVIEEIYLSRNKVKIANNIVYNGDYLIQAPIIDKDNYSISTINNHNMLINKYSFFDKKFNNYAFANRFNGGLHLTQDKKYLYEINTYHNEYISRINLKDSKESRLYLNKIKGISKINKYSYRDVQREYQNIDDTYCMHIIDERYIYIIFIRSGMPDQYIYDLYSRKVYNIDFKLGEIYSENRSIYILKTKSSKDGDYSFILNQYTLKRDNE